MTNPAGNSAVICGVEANSSAVLPRLPAARDLTGAAEAPSLHSRKPRPVCQHRDGASKTAPPTTSMKEVALYGDQGTRPRHADDDDRPARREDHHDHPQGRWFPVTAPTVEQVNLTAVEHDIAAVLVAHGLADHDTIQVAAYPIEQGGHTAGYSITALAYTRPAGLPTTRPAGDPFAATTKRLEAAS
jgi:hypothetical protein